jgi:hypothetical protein
MKIKTKDLTGAALDWAVATCEGYTLTTDGINQLVEKDRRLTILGTCTTGQGIPCGYSPSSYWSQGGPIIERESIAWRKHTVSNNWYAMTSADLGNGTIARWDEMTARGGERYGPESYAVRKRQQRFDGATPLIAAMRCYVASQLGAEVEVPDQLVG